VRRPDPRPPGNGSIPALNEHNILPPTEASGAPVQEHLTETPTRASPPQPEHSEILWLSKHVSKLRPAG